MEGGNNGTAAAASGTKNPPRYNKQDDHQHYVVQQETQMEQHVCQEQQEQNDHKELQVMKNEPPQEPEEEQLQEQNTTEVPQEEVLPQKKKRRPSSIKKRKCRLNSTEKQNMIAILEHLIITGNYNRHRQWRVDNNELRKKNAQLNHSVDDDDEEEETQPLSKGGTSSASVRSGLGPPDDDDKKCVADGSNNNNDDFDEDEGDASTTTGNHHQKQQETATSNNKKRKLLETKEQPEPALIRMIHAQDSRIYNVNVPHYEGQEIDATFPKANLLGYRRKFKSDENWDRELSDGIHPVGFAKMRLSSAVQPIIGDGTCMASQDDNVNDERTTRLPENYDLDPSTSTSNNIDENETSRAMVLKCWERAVHAAASTVRVVVAEKPPPVSNNNETTVVVGATSTTEGTDAEEEDDDDDIEHNNNNCRDRDRTKAIAVCQQLGIEPLNNFSSSSKRNLDNNDNNDDEGGVVTSSERGRGGAPPPDDDNNDDKEEEEIILPPMIRCNICNIEMSSLKKCYEDHFYGTDTTLSGCCWLLIERRRREILAQTLESELQCQAQTLLRTVLIRNGANAKSGNDGNKRLFNCFDVLAILESQLAESRRVVVPGDRQQQKSSDRDGHLFETLQVEEGMPPLPINNALLEAVRYRLVDRYAKVPR